MGLDLAICPDYFHVLQKEGDRFLAYHRLGFQRDYDLFADIAETGYRRGVAPVCRPAPLPKSVVFEWYGDDGLERRREDPYGKPLTFVPAGELAKVNARRSTEWNIALMHFVRGLPPETAIVLWWH